jgi:hypothetical protein
MRTKLFARGLVVAGAVIVGLGSSTAFAVAPTAQAFPHRKLVDGQTVKVKGANFPASTTVTIVECNANVATDKAAACDLSNLVTAMTTSAGAVPGTQYTVHTGSIGEDGGTCDHTHPCSIEVSTADQQNVALAPIKFHA